MFLSSSRAQLEDLLHQDHGHNPGAGNGCYWGTYDFLEKVRLVRGEKKSARRLAAEAKHPPREIFNIHGGYRLKNDDGTRWVFTGMTGR